MKLSKVWILIALLIPIHAFSQHILFPNWSVSEHQPNLEEGGRTSSVAVNPMNRNEMFAASDSGGLFKSIDRGQSWTHVDSLEVIFTQAVAYLPAHPNVVLVSAKADFKTDNGGGLWRSDNGGMTWAQVEVKGLPAGRLSAYGISALGEEVVVGTSAGIFASTDGEHFTFAAPFGGGDTTVFSVLLTRLGNEPSRIYAGGPAGVKLATMLPPPLPQDWDSPANLANDEVRSIHALDAPPASPYAFLTAENRLFWTQDGGTTWTQIPLAPAGNGTCRGTAFIKALVSDRDVFTLYYGNTCDAHRLLATAPNFNGQWQLLMAEHFPRDLALFQTDPMLLASNGGLHDTDDLGLHWTYVGGGKAGYNALQVTDIKGQYIRKANHTLDLYFGTQDNSVWAMDVLGNPHARFADEGFFIDAERQVGVPADSRITYVACDVVGGCRPVIATRHLANGNDIGHSTLLAAAPVVIRQDRRIQNVMNGLDMSLDRDMTMFQPFAQFFQEPRGIPKLAFADGMSDHTIVYQTYRWSTLLTRLLHIDFAGGVGTVTDPPMRDFGTFGITRLVGNLAWYPAYGIDSGDSRHLLAADTGNWDVTKTTTSGEKWERMPTVTSVVTRNSELMFEADVPGLSNNLPLVTAISFAPGDPNQVLLGTNEGGIYYSSNRGETFAPLTGSRLTTFVTSFFWSSLNTVYVSTFGRGIWRLNNRPIAPPDAFDDLCGTCGVVSDDGPGRPPFDHSVLVFDGSILGRRTINRQLREVFVTPGSSVVFTGDPKDLQEDITITEGECKDCEALPKPPKDGWIATGVVFMGDDTLTGTVFAESEMRLPPPPEK